MPAAASLKPPPPPTLRPSRLPRAFPANSCPAVAPVTAGWRPGNRGPLLRGRVLSTEAILAVQALKRAADGGLSGEVRRVAVSTAARLLRADLLAALAELRRQGRHRLALEVFVAVRRNFWPEPDLALYAEMVSAMAKNGMRNEIDLLVPDLLEEKEGRGGVFLEDLREMGKVLRALIDAGKGGTVRDIYREMRKRRGWVPNESLFRVLIRGLRGLGEEEMADEVEKDFCELQHVR